MSDRKKINRKNVVMLKISFIISLSALIGYEIIGLIEYFVISPYDWLGNLVFLLFILLAPPIAYLFKILVNKNNILNTWLKVSL